MNSNLAVLHCLVLSGTAFIKFTVILTSGKTSVADIKTVFNSM